MESPPPAIELVDVSKRFGARWAVARLSYSLPAGRSLLLTGHNGSGKTTLLRMIATATFPTAGSIQIFGEETRASPRRAAAARWRCSRHASFLYEDLTAAQNLTLVAQFLASRSAEGPGRQGCWSASGSPAAPTARCASSLPACASACRSPGC